MVWKLIRITLIIYVGQPLCKNIVFHCHVCIVLWPSPPIAILKLTNCLSHGWLTFLKRCYWFVRQEYNKHMTTKDLISAWTRPCIRDVPDPDSTIRYPVKCRHPALSGWNSPDIYRIVLWHILLQTSNVKLDCGLKKTNMFLVENSEINDKLLLYWTCWTSYTV